MRRRADWEARLAAYLAPLRTRPFAWGAHDCCSFASGAVLAMTDIDPMPEFRGRYATAIGAARALRRIGAGDLAATMNAKFAGVDAGLARRGDIVMTAGVLAICWGAFAIAVGAEGGREGLIRLERATWVDARGWHVPF